MESERMGMKERMIVRKKRENRVERATVGECRTGSANDRPRCDDAIQARGKAIERANRDVCERK